MELKNFDELIKKARDRKDKKAAVVVAAQDEHILKAVFQAKQENIIEPILIGDRNKIIEILENNKYYINESHIINEEKEQNAAVRAVEFVKNNQAELIIKGKVQTSDLLKPVLQKENGLLVDRTISHIAIHEMNNYHKLLAATDGGIIMYPDLKMKKQIVENAVSLFHKFGYKNPKVAILTAIEKTNKKMPETIDAQELKQMNIDGEIKDCVVEGPISYDLTMSKESAEIKGFASPVTGNADILVVPNMLTGNILGKSLIYSANAKMAGLVIGAKVPIVLTSRGATYREKYLSIIISSFY